MPPRNAFEGLSTEAKQTLIIDKLTSVLTAIGGLLKAGETVQLDAGSLASLESITATIQGKVDLSDSTLAALENITVGGTVGLSEASLAALETINVGGTVALDSASLASLEQITATVAGGAVALDQNTLDALESITVTLANGDIASGAKQDTTNTKLQSVIDKLSADAATNAAVAIVAQAIDALAIAMDRQAETMPPRALQYARTVNDAMRVNVENTASVTNFPYLGTSGSALALPLWYSQQAGVTVDQREVQREMSQQTFNAVRQGRWVIS